VRSWRQAGCAIPGSCPRGRLHGVVVPPALSVAAGGRPVFWLGSPRCWGSVRRLSSFSTTETTLYFAMFGQRSSPHTPWLGGGDGTPSPAGRLDGCGGSGAAWPGRPHLLSSHVCRNSITLFEHTIAVNPRTAAWPTQLGWRTRRRFDTRTPSGTTRRPQPAAPDDPHLRANYGTSLANLGRFDEAEASIARPSRLTPTTCGPAGMAHWPLWRILSTRPRCAQPARPSH